MVTTADYRGISRVFNMLDLACFATGVCNDAGLLATSLCKHAAPVTVRMKDGLRDESVCRRRDAEEV